MTISKTQAWQHKPSKQWFVTLLSACLVFASTSFSAVAQTSKQDQKQNGEAQVTLNLQNVDIRVLINTVAEVSGKNFIVDPRVKGKVSVISGASLNPEQLYDVFLSILEVHNFATVDSGSVIKVLPSNVIKQRPTPTLFSPTEDTNDSQITQIIQLKHASVQDLVPIVRPLIPPTSHFAPHVPSNSVVLTDTAANIQRVLKIIKRIDVPDKRSNVRVVYLEKSKASDLAATLTQIVSSTGDPKTAAAGAKVTIQPLDSINALVVSATDDEFAKIQALINELDIERDLQSDVNVIYLKHAKAEDLVSILNDVTAGQAEGAISDFSVQADEATNALIVKASGNQLKAVQGVIDKLDLRRAQVFVETVIAEVSLDQAADFGVTWGAGGATETTSGGSPAVPGADGAPDTPATAGTTTSVGNLVDRTGRIIGSAGANTAFDLATGGLTYSLLDFKKYRLDVIVSALRSDTNSNILSTPTILTLDNEEAEIVVGQEVPFVTGRFNNGLNNSTNVDGDGNATGGSVGNSFQTIERKDVGIKLRIKPQISDGDTIQLEIMQEISSVAPVAIDGQADLITNRRSIEAVVQADDGQVVVLGGLIQDDVTDVVNYVPILGKIPLIGALFRSKSKDAIKRNLMVFLKPRIIRSPDELAKYSKIKYDEVRRDGEFSRLKSSKFLIEDAEPPVLDAYDNVIGDGELATERRRDIRNGKSKKKRTIIDLFKRRDKSAEFETQGDLEQAVEELENEFDQNKPVVELPDDVIEWGTDTPPAPKPEVIEE